MMTGIRNGLALSIVTILYSISLHAQSSPTVPTDDEIRKIVMGAYDRARTLIEHNTQPMRALAEALLDQESLEADEIKQLLEKAGAARC